MKSRLDTIQIFNQLYIKIMWKISLASESKKKNTKVFITAAPTIGGLEPVMALTGENGVRLNHFDTLPLSGQGIGS